ncbi:hypothetical protein HKX48_002874 [Thoreauomyces humboldtii]|nr:hypothetical protein HKX48_002874 [Thoreauomyces humboldtii]
MSIRSLIVPLSCRRSARPWTSPLEPCGPCSKSFRLAASRSSSALAYAPETPSIPQTPASLGITLRGHTPVESEVAASVRDDCKTLRDSAQWFSEKYREEKDQTPNASVYLVERLSPDNWPEDPWTLYNYLALDSERLPFASQNTFTCLLAYLTLAVTSPQICLDRITKVIADMSQAGFILRDRDWALVADAYAKWGKLENLPHMQKEIRRLTSLAAGPQERQERRKFSDSGFFRAVLELYTGNRDLFAVRHLIEDMLEDCAHTQIIYQAAIDKLVRLRAPALAFVYYERMLSERIYPDRATYKTILHGISLEKMIKVSTGIMDTLDLANHVLEQALKQYIDTGLFAATLEVYARHNNLGKAQILLRLMQERGVRPDRKIFLSFFHMNLCRNQLDDSRAILRSLLSNPKRCPNPMDPTLHRFVLHSYVRTGYLFEALQHFWGTKGKVRLDSWTLEMLIVRFADWRPRRAVEVWERMLETGLNPSLEIRTMMADLLESLKRGEEAEELRRKVAADMALVAPRVSPVVPCYNALLL